jgi:hypothetical protein
LQNGAHNSPSSNAKVKNAWSHTSTIFLHGVGLLIKRRKKFTIAVIDKYLWNLRGGGEPRGISCSLLEAVEFQAVDRTELMNHVWLNGQGQGESSMHIRRGDTPRLVSYKKDLLLNFDSAELVISPVTLGLMALVSKIIYTVLHYWCNIRNRNILVSLFS